jgi:hypothetical protein
VTVAKDKGDFEFRLRPASPARPVLIEVGDVQFYFEPGGETRFAPAPGTPYRVALAEKFQAKSDGERTIAVIPAGKTGTTKLQTGLSFLSLQALPVKPWLYDITPTLAPVRATGQPGLSDLSVEVRQPGFRFDQEGFVVDACAWRSPGAPGSGSRVGVAEIKATGLGAGTARLTVSSDVIPAWPLQLADATFNIRVVLSSLDGKYKAYGGFTAVPKLLAAVAASLIVGGLLWWLIGLRTADVRTQAASYRAQGFTASAQRLEDTGQKAWFASLFLGNDHQPSLSLFQIFFWTVITVWGMTYVYLATGNLITMTTSMMGLLGIAGAGSVIARWISPDVAPPTTADAASIKPFAFWQILGTNGNFDLLKLQLFVFTLTIGVYVVWRIADTAAFPDIDANTLLLLGVSQGVYIGGKLAGSTALSRAQSLKTDIATKKEARANLAAQIATDQSTLGGPPALPPGQQRTDIEARVAANKPKLADLDKAIAGLEADLANAIKDLGLS